MCVGTPEHSSCITNITFYIIIVFLNCILTKCLCPTKFKRYLRGAQHCPFYKFTFEYEFSTLISLSHLSFYYLSHNYFISGIGIKGLKHSGLFPPSPTPPPPPSILTRVYGRFSGLSHIDVKFEVTVSYFCSTHSKCNFCFDQHN